jgi:hypothetical protein
LQRDAETVVRQRIRRLQRQRPPQVAAERLQSP